ncbi:MAG: sulfurtransferase [Oceanospirillaceae bacterium]|jgi:rhodanese-related sulfurtransferase|uniref:rhodanese-like domain-containing protein n=1 Tax=unclassified Thalassolituus TaxID=2624967 RepID=UPI000B636843|nr:MULTISPECIES: rhodanese-like domain-containing protein [unclassified Thalassolituus]MAE35951.1 sulfurtransferase [Oceanospirillaceae bacterium]MBN56809.1 sulfurtransferase [Oceanospirillaceae bacterium]MDQ4425280.1 rhodanese-like domain-containing protein [Thalassolituus sp.]OUX64818.1 MAG: sulfurtransferase [Oceanospirillaceae bacterium TMED276]|tara:strand:+ start:16798 stop:17211 length:414 start_codon:yes stop_codon:yes gene_type:complete
MDQYIEFVVNHWWLVGIWAAFLIALLWDNNRRNGQTVSTTEATTMINRQDALVLDIRDKADFKAGHLVNAINIPYASLAQRMNELEKERERPIVLVCKTGQTVSMAGKMLREKGFNAVRMKGGMMEWNSQNLPVVKN